MLFSFSSLLIFLSILIHSTFTQAATSISFEINGGDGLVYLLILIFFLINILTPLNRFIYVKYLNYIVLKANSELSKVSKKFSEKVSDVSRKVSQTVRK